MNKTKRRQVMRRRRTPADIAYAERKKQMRAEQRARRNAPISFTTTEDIFLYTYRPVVV